MSFTLYWCIGYDAYPDAVAILLGVFCCCSIAYFLSAPTENSAQKDKVNEERADEFIDKLSS
jgi:hypothetical protein